MSRAILTSHKTFSDITPTQYETAYNWLEKTGLLKEPRASHNPGFYILERSLICDAPPWFQDAGFLVREPDELPADVIQAAEALGLSFSEAYACVTATWGKVDAQERKRIGDAGEVALANLIATETTAQVDHVAADSDGLGFDLLIKCNSFQSHIEVKTTTRTNRVTIYISRNEFETMKCDRAWRLVVVRLGKRMEALAVATVSNDWLSTNAPSDVNSHGRWEAYRLDVPVNELQLGMPFLNKIPISEPGHPLITGKISWNELVFA